ncbi:MAG: hypothetical protein K6E43_02425 [Lachnospiraceae bacterium]|nr:hypothetical protein [Lachnospiraceae bacterium]
MTFWIGLRTKIRKLVMNNETNFIRGTRFVTALIALAMINANFGYQKALSHWWTALIVAAICAFIPSQAGSVVVAFVCIVQLMALSTDVGVAALVIAVVAYAVTAYFKAQNQYNNVAIAVSHQMKIPFIIPVVSGLLGNFNDMSGVVCGSVVAYYLKVVKENASAFLDETNEISATELIQTKMISNTMFYVYIAAMVIGFMLIYYLRTKEIKHAWIYGVGLGCLTQFVIMLAGCLFVGNKSAVPTVFLGSIVTFLLGLLIIFFFQGLDYSRIEKVQYEDDDYYYYVTAIPKTHIAEQEKEIKKITDAESLGLENVEDEDAE